MRSFVVGGTSTSAVVKTETLTCREAKLHAFLPVHNNLCAFHEQPTDDIGRFTGPHGRSKKMWLEGHDCAAIAVAALVAMRWTQASKVQLANEKST
jgi:hypothetical protein